MSNQGSLSASKGDAAWFWLKLGFVSFGGPAGQIALMHREMVETRRWIAPERFQHALSYCMLLPGPEAQQLACYLGWLMHGRAMGVLAGVLFILPGLVLMLALAVGYFRYQQQAVVLAFFQGLQPAILAIVAVSVVKMLQTTLWSSSGANAVRSEQRRKRVWKLGLVVLTAAVTAWPVIPFPAWMLISALIGYLSLSGGNSAVGSSDSAEPRDSIDSRVASRTPSARVSLAALCTGGLIWLSPLGVLAALNQPKLVQLGGFFSQSALVTFGGAYALLPFVLQAGVQQFAWITPTQMVHGMALGESTPGPLILVLVFVAFLGGAQQQMLGPDYIELAGLLAALLCTWCIFVPSFLFILIGAPWVEAARSLRWLDGAMQGIKAAVLGAMLYLAGFFALHTLFPGLPAHPGWSQWSAHFSPGFALIACVCALLMQRFGVSSVKVVALACALSGLQLFLGG